MEDVERSNMTTSPIGSNMTQNALRSSINRDSLMDRNQSTSSLQTTHISLINKVNNKAAEMKEKPSRKDMLRTLANIKLEADPPMSEEVPREEIIRTVANMKREQPEETNTSKWRWKCGFGPSCPVCLTLSDKELEELMTVKEPPLPRSRFRVKWRPNKQATRTRDYLPRKAKERARSSLIAACE